MNPALLAGRPVAEGPPRARGDRVGSIPARAMCKADAGRGPRAAAEHRRQRGSQPDAAAAPDDPVDERIDDASAEAAERVRQHQRQPRAAEDVEQRTDNASGPRATPPVAPESPRVRHGSCPSDSAGGRRNSRPSSTSSLSRARRWRLARFCETDRARGPGRPRRRRRRNRARRRSGRAAELPIAQLSADGPVVHRRRGELRQDPRRAASLGRHPPITTGRSREGGRRPARSPAQEDCQQGTSNMQRR